MSLLIKIGTTAIDTVLPTWNKFVYSCGVKTYASGFNRLLESIFRLFLAMETFSRQKKLLRCLKKW